MALLELLDAGDSSASFSFFCAKIGGMGSRKVEAFLLQEGLIIKFLF